MRVVFNGLSIRDFQSRGGGSNPLSHSIFILDREEVVGTRLRLGRRVSEFDSQFPDHVFKFMSGGKSVVDTSPWKGEAVGSIPTRQTIFILSVFCILFLFFACGTEYIESLNWINHY